MLDIMTIEKINKFVDENCAELTPTQKTHCFSKLYSSFGSMSYDEANTELMMTMLKNALEEVKPKPKAKRKPKYKKIRYVILEPRYHDKTVLLAKMKMPDAPVEVVFTNSKSLGGILFEINGAWVKENCTLGTNGVIPCYVVPLEALENKGAINDEKPKLEQNLEPPKVTLER